jgi:pimeloyl-ACP methyl ester carboxylesterase
MLYARLIHAAPRGADATGFLFCGPFAEENFYVAPVFAAASARLAGAGHAVMRFDYRGCGNSAGPSDAVDLDGWLEDTRRAVDTFSERTGVGRITLIGLRLGATAAVLTAASRPDDLIGLCLWEPVIDGEAYLREKRREESIRSVFLSSGDRGGGESGDWEEIAGYRISRRFIAQIAGLSLLSEPPEIPCAARIIHCTCAPKNRDLVVSLAETLRAGGTPAEHVEVRSAPFWCGFTRGGFEGVLDATQQWAQAVAGGSRGGD